LGKVLSNAKSNATVKLMPVDSFYTRPVFVELSQQISLKVFGMGSSLCPKR